MKRSLVAVIALLVLLVFAASGYAHGHDHGHKKEKKQGILLVAFGSSYPQAQVSFENIEAKVKKAFPKTPVRWAYTSKIIRGIMAEKGQDLASPAVALAEMMDQGFTHVAVQSLHTIGGAEFHDLLGVVKGFEAMPGAFEEIIVGDPLLASQKDIAQVSELLLQNVPGHREADQAVIFMGHGTHHPSNAFYSALMYNLQQKDSNAYVAVVEGWPLLEDIKEELEQKQIEKAYLLPFMSVAGDHVRNDMAGDEPDSWISVLNKDGIKCETVLKGTAEYDDIADVWVGHLKDVMAHF